MTIPRWWWHAARKDVLALAPTWTWCAVGMVAGFATLNPVAGLVGYLLGSTALGALVIGHEYSHRTMPGLLAMPVSRRQMLAVKYGVLVVMLAALALLAWLSGVTHTSGAFLGGYGLRGRMALLLPPICGLCLAPWLTMLSRSPLGGAVFAGGLVCTLAMFGQLLATLRFIAPSRDAAITLLESLFPLPGMLAMCAIGAVATWITFGRLQVTGIREIGIRLRRRPSATTQLGERSAGATETGRRRWMSALIVKELHLYSILLAVTLFYVAVWYVLAATRPAVPTPLRLPLPLVTVVFGGAVAILAGSFASAEERHLGTMPWQQLLPLASRRQWAIKVVVLLVVVLALGAGVPVLLQSITLDMVPGDDTMPDVQPLMVAALAIASLYVSSLSPTGLRAVVASVAVVLVAAFAGGRLLSLAESTAKAADPFLRRAEWRPWLQDAAGVCFAVVFALAVVRFAMKNHRTAERSLGVIRKQVAWLSVIALGSTIAVGLVAAATQPAVRPAVGVDGVQVRGRVVFNGSSRPLTPEVLSNLGVSLERAGTPPRNHSVLGRVTSDGSFSTAFAPPGEYFIRVTWIPRGSPWAFKDATFQGRDVSQTAIDLTDTIDGVVITLTDHAGTIDGTVQKTSDGTTDGTIVLLFPVDSLRWVDYGRSSRRIQAIAVGSAGDFAITMPPDGDYFLAAIRRQESGGVFRNRYSTGFDRDPAALFRRLAPVAERIQAREGATITRTLTVKRP